MSATIGANDANFVVFGSGHDYTRIDSGDGMSRWFSHKKVPLGSRLYANQFLFYVPDEDGNRIDAVRFDMSHCTNNYRDYLRGSNFFSDHEGGEQYHEHGSQIIAESRDRDRGITEALKEEYPVNTDEYSR